MKQFILIISCFYMPIYAQQSENKYSITDNDNWKYFYDIGFESGLYSSTNAGGNPSGSINTLTGSYFLSDKLGFRSGISLISEMDGSNYYWKIPLLFSFRTKTFSGVFYNIEDIESFKDFFVSFLLYLLPTRFEFNVGTSLGYISPNDSQTDSYRNGERVHVESSIVNREFASSLDANFRLSYQIWRICLNGNLGINYLWTRNFNHYDGPWGNVKTNPSWFGNLSAGISFRF